MRPICLAVLTACVVCGCAWQQMFTHPASQKSKEQLDELVRTIDDDPDTLHFDRTPSVRKLIEVGDPAIPRMLDLMLLDGKGDRTTRLHAETVLYCILLKKCGFDPREDGHDPEGGERANALWKSLGDLDYEAPLAERERSVKLWRAWLAKNKA